jgi:hypothetical protein
VRTVPRLALLAAALLQAALARASVLSASFPPGVPDASALRWERITGDVSTAEEAASYEFYVNPVRKAIYEVVRFRFTWHGTERAETVVWNPPPAVGRAPVCFVHDSNGGWRALKAGTPEYRDELLTVIRVYALHRNARLSGEADEEP